ncbi:unnamed protein product [Periconia digitata]|uniref:Uncharacterized protein n=1 Tax=Periconia digitata TaxID=1303443 RepID=A0A9W4U9J9_9PLEO|nr:unnamed protein product [Periconia digitata]
MVPWCNTLFAVYLFTRRAEHLLIRADRRCRTLSAKHGRGLRMRCFIHTQHTIYVRNYIGH